MNIQLSEHFTYKKLVHFILPSIAMMIFTSVYGVVDGFFVSNFAGKTPFAAVNLIMPFLMILGTVGFIFGTGGTAIVAKNLGEGKVGKANSCFSLFTYTAFILGVVFAGAGIIFIKPVSIMLGAEGELLENCITYANIILLALPFYVLQLLFQSFFVSAQKPQLGLVVTVSSGVVNIIFDALLVILLPVEHKLQGAAVATAISQVVGGAVPLVYFFRKNTSILRLGKTKLDGKAIAKACVNGSSEFMSNVSMSLVGMLYNIQLIKYAGENGVAAYGVMMYVSFVFASAFIGYSIGTAPVISYHFGAGNGMELKNLLRKSVVLIGMLGIAMVCIAEVLSYPFAKMFVGYDNELMSITLSGFRIFALSFLCMGYAIFGSGFFTALNDGIVSAVISFLRTIVFQMASVIILPLIFDINGIWYSIILAEFMATVLSGIFVIIKKQKYGYL